MNKVELTWEQNEEIKEGPNKGKVHKVTKTKKVGIPDSMTAWKEFALGIESPYEEDVNWIPFKKGQTSRVPKPGDILITLNSKYEFAHVCVVFEVNGDKWRTADGGQGNGFAIGMIDKTVDFTAGTIKTKSYSSDIRYVDGWVDLESLLA
jgi:hypothetical protein